MITDMNARVAMAQKLSIPQLQQAIKNGTVPAYVGIPLLQDKMRQQQQMAMAQQGQQAQQQPPIAEQIMAEAGAMDGGIDQLPSNLPITDDEEDYAGGGIIAFKDEGQVRDSAKIPTSQLTEAQFDALPKEEQDARIADYEMDRNIKEAGTGTAKLLSTIPAFIGASAMTPFSRFAENITPVLNTKPMQYILRKTGVMDPGQTEIVNRVPTVSDLYGEKGVRGILDSVGNDIKASLYAPTLRQTLQARDGRTETIGPQVLAPNPNVSDEPETIGPQGLREIPFTPARTATTGATGTSSSGATSTGTGKTTTAGATTSTPRAEATAAEAAPAPMSALDKYAEMLMGERANIAKDRQQARAMALVQAGLGVAGGTSPNPFANLAQGIIPATQAYQAEMKGIRKEDADRLKHLMAMGVSKEKLALEAKKLGITEKHYEQMFQAAMARAGAGNEERAAQRAFENQRRYGQLYEVALKNREAAIAKAYPMGELSPPINGMSYSQAMASVRNDPAIRQYQKMAFPELDLSEPTGGGSASNVMGSYVPGKGYIPNK